MIKLKFKHKADARLFKRGEPMWSPDGGKNWYRGEPPPKPIEGLNAWLRTWADCPCGSEDHQLGGHPGGFVVTKVDTLRGSVTIGPVKR